MRIYLLSPILNHQPLYIVLSPELQNETGLESAGFRPVTRVTDALMIFDMSPNPPIELAARTVNFPFKSASEIAQDGVVIQGWFHSRLPYLKSINPGSIDCLPC